MKVELTAFLDTGRVFSNAGVGAPFVSCCGACSGSATGFSTTFPNVRQDAINEWDPSILKQFNVTEKSYLQLRFEFFKRVERPEFRPSKHLKRHQQRIRSHYGISEPAKNDPARRPFRVLIRKAF